MHYLTVKFFKSFKLNALSVFIVLVSFINSVDAQRIFDFYIENPASTEIQVKVIAWDCYEAQMPNGQVYFIKPGEKIKLGYIARRQGHGCDGKNSGFTLEITPGQREGKTVNFVFDNGGTLWLQEMANRYPGKLNPKSGNSYTYTTFKNKKLTAGRVTGYWERVSQGGAGKVWQVVKNETSKSTTISKETKEAISISLEAGMDFKIGASAKATVTGSIEKTSNESMTETLSSSTEVGEEIVYATLQERHDWNINTVWQWVGTTKMSDGSIIKIKTKMLTCTSDANPPNYAPGDPKDIGTCTGKLKK